MAHVAIIGSGIIGRSWAIVAARAGLQARLVIRRAEARAEVAKAILAAVENAMPITPTVPVEEVMKRITFVASLEEAASGAGYVFEAIREDVEEKAALFRMLEGIAPKDAILASSTSSFGASRFASELQTRSRVIVAHPLAPPHLMPATEIVPAPFTALETVETSFELMRALGQKPLLVRREQPGFVMNRMQGALLLEMMRVVEEGLMEPEDVDSIIRDGFGLRWAFLGPFAGIDLNAPGGIADYLKRYGFMFEDFARERGMKTPAVTPSVVAELHDALRAHHPLTEHSNRLAERDRLMARLRALRRDEGVN